MNLVPQLTHQHEIHFGFRFSVHFFTQKEPNRVDIRFQKVSGFGRSLATEDLPEGGQNSYLQKVPTRVHYENLKLERGMLVHSALKTQFLKAMAEFQVTPVDVLVILLNELAQPVTAWLFRRAFPVKWSTSDLDASEPRILIDSLELAYAEMTTLEEGP